MTPSNKILAVLDDLMFTVKINDAAKRAGLACSFLKSEHDVLLQAAEGPRLIFIDLNTQAVQAVDLIRKLKADPATSGIRLVGFVSHVQGELKQQAQEAGCDMVLARSAFSANLPALLGRPAS